MCMRGHRKNVTEKMQSYATISSVLPRSFRIFDFLGGLWLQATRIFVQVRPRPIRDGFDAVLRLLASEIRNENNGINSKFS